MSKLTPFVSLPQRGELPLCQTDEPFLLDFHFSVGVYFFPVCERRLDFPPPTSSSGGMPFSMNRWLSPCCGSNKHLALPLCDAFIVAGASVICAPSMKLALSSSSQNS